MTKLQISPEVYKFVLEFVKSIPKLSGETGFPDWFEKLRSILELCGLEHLLELSEVVDEPAFAKPTSKSIRRSLKGLKDKEKKKAQKIVDRELEKWDEYEKFKQHSKFVFIVAESAIDSSSEAYADVRTNPEKCPAKLLDDLSKRFQPSCASHHASLLLKILKLQIEEATGVRGVVDRINQMKALIESSGGSVPQEVLKLGILSAISDHPDHQHHLMPKILEKFDKSFADIAREATDYATNLKNLGQKQETVDEESGPRVLLAKGSPRNHAMNRATGGMVCHHCKKPGHFIADCPDAGPTCENCGRRGHVKKKCPVRKVTPSKKFDKKSKKRGRDERDDDEYDSDDSKF